MQTLDYDMNSNHFVTPSVKPIRNSSPSSERHVMHIQQAQPQSLTPETTPVQSSTEYEPFHEHNSDFSIGDKALQMEANAPSEYSARPGSTDNERMPYLEEGGMPLVQKSFQNTTSNVTMQHLPDDLKRCTPEVTNLYVRRPVLISPKLVGTERKAMDMFLYNAKQIVENITPAGK